jgi:hypothetical protein
MCEDIHRGDPNPTGTFEDKEFLWRGLQAQSAKWMFCREIVRGYADAIRERNHRFVVWGVKEPRFMFVLPAFLQCFEDVRFVVVKRSADATEKSFAKWQRDIDGPPLERQRAEMERCLTLGQRLGIGTWSVWYEALVADPANVVVSLADWAFDGLHVKPTDEDVARAVAFVDPKLRHF